MLHPMMEGAGKTTHKYALRYFQTRQDTHRSVSSPRMKKFVRLLRHIAYCLGRGTLCRIGLYSFLKELEKFSSFIKP